MGDAPAGAPRWGSRLECVLLGHRWQRRDTDNARDHVEYVLRVSWRPEDPPHRHRSSHSHSRSGSRQSGAHVWLVARRFRDFRALHCDLQREHRDLPRFPSRHGVASLLGRNRREAFVATRERLLERYLTALLADPNMPREPAVDRLLELSARLEGPATGRSEDDADRDVLNAEWLDYQLKLRLMELVDDTESDDAEAGRTRALTLTLAESVELLRPQLQRAARSRQHAAQATRVLKKFADSLATLGELRQRDTQRRATR